MYLEKINLTNFRNYSVLDLALGPGPVILWGGNAQGKSNLLEAVYLLATTRSSRATSDREMIRWEALEDSLPVARVAGEMRRGGERIRLEVALGLEPPLGAGPDAAAPSLRKQAKMNGVPSRASEVVGNLNVVMFGPGDVDLVGGPPSERRRYLDVANSQVDREYLRALQSYTRVLVQRNHLLRLIREARGRRQELSFWNEKLAQDGALIHLRRLKMLAELGDLARVIYSELAAGEELEVVYLPSPSGLGTEANIDYGHNETAAAFRSRLDSNLEQEIAQGITLIGPHRDDLQFLVRGRDMGLYGSRGEQRTIVCALKLAEANFLVRRTGEDPVLLLDDILSELDFPRRQQVLTTALSNEQTILTTTDLDRLDQGFLSRATILKVECGVITPWARSC